MSNNLHRNTHTDTHTHDHVQFVLTRCLTSCLNTANHKRKKMQSLESCSDGIVILYNRIHFSGPPLSSHISMTRQCIYFCAHSVLYSALQVYALFRVEGGIENSRITIKSYRHKFLALDYSRSPYKFVGTFTERSQLRWIIISDS